MNKRMRAVVIPQTGGIEVLRSKEQPVPDPAPGEVLVRNRSAGVNFVDALIRRGQVPSAMMPNLPFVPGVEGAGVIEAVGAEVNLAPGQSVMWFGPLGAGGYGEFSLVESVCVVPIAASIDPAFAAAVPVNYMTAYHMLFNLGRLQRGDWVLVHAAAGGVGTAVLQLARHAGFRTIASVSTGKVPYAVQAGALHAIDYRNEDVASRVREISGGGVKLSLNPIGGATIQQDVSCLAPLGQVINFGFLGGLPQGTLADSLAANFTRSIGIRVSDIYTYFGADPAGFHSDFEHIAKLLAEGKIQPRVHARLHREEAAQAHRLLESGEVIGKIVLLH
jgi:NADPH:quinone reductase